LIGIIKELLPVIHQPIAALFAKAKVGSHIDALFKTLKRIIKVMDKGMSETPDANQKGKDILQRVSDLETVFQRFMSDLYEFVHHIAFTDTGALEKSLKWALGISQEVQQEHLNVQSLLSALSLMERDTLKSEIDSLMQYTIWMMDVQTFEHAENVPNREGESSTKPVEPPKPVLVAIPKLVPNFIELANSTLNPQFTLGDEKTLQAVDVSRACGSATI